jgi:hypothetical protein
MFIDDLVNSIFRMEGSNSPNSINQTLITQYGLYNPGHLTYANQPGAVPVKIGTHTWAGFATYDDAVQAVKNQINLDASRGFTLETFIGKYAPSFENNTGNYINSVASWLGISSVGAKLSDLLSGSPSSSGNGNDAVLNVGNEGYNYLDTIMSTNDPLGNVLPLVLIGGIAVLIAVSV